MQRDEAEATAPLAGAPLEFDPFSYEQDEDPYPVYRWMRDEAPAYHNPRLDFWVTVEIWDQA